MWGWGRKRKLGHSLDRSLLHWSQYDPYRVRDLLNGGLLVIGRSGSGKTSSSGRTVAQAIVNDPDSAGLVILPKPEDIHLWKDIFRKARRLKDMVVFDARNDRRFNFLNYLGNGEARDFVQAMLMIGETLQRGERGGGEDALYWQAQVERLLETAVIALQCAGEPVTAENLHRFVMTAATSPKEVGEQSWQAKYHGQVIEKGFYQKTPRQAHDYELAKDYWLLEFPGMADRTRSSILTYATQILHVFNSGLCRQTIGGVTNVSPDDILHGAWVVVNFPPAMGATHAFISAGWKYLTELAILKRQARETSPFVTVWCDEAHQTVTSFDSSFIAQCRSHKGCLVNLTQSVSSFYAAMKGEAGRHQADALLANFSHVIVHACDPVTAKWGTAKLGRRKEVLYSGGFNQRADAGLWDQMFGNNQFHGNFSEHYEQVLQDQEFMIGRTGGPKNTFLTDAIVVKSGEPFADGRSYKRVVFSQR